MKGIGRALRAAGFDEGAVATVIGPAPHADAVPVHARRLPLDDPRTVLARLFVLGETVPSAALPVPVEDLVAAGLAELHNDAVRAPLRLSPFDELLIAHDGEDRIGEAGYVTGVNAAARTLSTLTVRRPVERALDLGTGCGVQALLAAGHVGTVVATDLNPRALEYAALNARLNEQPLDLREGSLFEPVGDELFDLVVANPPFVISPDSEFLFRDSGLPGDEFTRAVVRGAGLRLREGGFATVLCNWICRSADERWEPLVPWVEAFGCDALVLAHEPVDPFSYAARWNEPARRDPSAFAAAIERWLDYYERERVAAIGIGAVILRRRTGENWIRGFELRRPPTGDAGEQILRIFAAADRLAEADDDAWLLAERFRHIAGHRLDQSLTYRENYEISGVVMSLTDGVGLVGEIEPEMLPVLFALEPGRRLDEILAEVEIDASEALPTVRRLYEQGFLERVS